MAIYCPSALAIFTQDNRNLIEEEVDSVEVENPQNNEAHWHWRLREVEALAAQLDPKRFGVKGFYVFGSTKNATAGPASDIDVLIHFIGDKKQQNELNTWLEGWSLSLSQLNYLKTGYKTAGLLDVHLITDEDIQNRTSYAIKIGAVSDAARPLALGTDLKK